MFKGVRCLVKESSIQPEMDRIFYSSGIRYFDSDMKTFLEEILRELYYSSPELASKVRLKHIDRAIFKFRKAKERTCICNTKQYFKACVASAISEIAFDDLEPVE
jgi:hypothetical protein